MATKKKATARSGTGAHVATESPLTRMLRAALAFFTGEPDTTQTPVARKTAPRARAKVKPKPPGVSPRVKSPIAAAMLAWVPDQMLAGTPPPRKAARLDRRPPGITVKLSAVAEANAFLFAIMFDHMIRWEAAWEAPYHLAQRLGHLDVSRIATMTEEHLGAVLKGKQGEKALHRLWPRLAKNLRAVSEILVRDYGGNAENIWPDNISIVELKRRLSALPGMGPKLTSMTIRILVEHRGRTFVDWQKADVAVDRHVARVFLRTGLVGDSKKKVYSVSELHDDVIRAAREAYPRYPAALDYPAFEVGRSYCRAETPSCSACPLREACPQERTTWRIG